MKKLLSLIIVFILVNSAGGVYFEFFRNELTLLIFLLSIFYLFGFQKKVNLLDFKTTSIALGIMSFFVIINLMYSIPGQSLNTYGYMFFVLIISFLLTLTMTNQNFFDRIRKILYVIEIHAFFSFFLYFAFQNSVVPAVADNGAEYITFHYLFFYLPKAEVSIFGLNFLRNSGLFWEPGILQFFLNMSLFIQFFYNKKISKLHVLSSMFLLFTTFSTSGYIVFLIILLYKYKTIVTLRNILFSFPLFVGLMIIIYPVLATNFENKFYGEDSASSFIRFYYTYQYLQIIKDYFIFGTGITVETLYQLQSNYYDISFMGDYATGHEAGGTNDILKILAMFGVPIGLILLIGMYKQEVFFKEKKLFFFILLLVLSAEPIGMRLFFIFLIMNGINGFVKKRLSKKR